jgi:diguanylate cyclase (GGDEF)-like protein
MGPHPFAVLIIEETRARLTRFTVDIYGETLWATDSSGAVRRLAASRPQLVAVVGERHLAAVLAEELRRRNLVQAVFVVTPADGDGPTPPGQIPVALPQGVVGLRTDELLPRLMEAILHAQQCLPVSPLTGLPGSGVLREEVERRLVAGRAFAFLYLDIDHFKAFNDTYGFGRGDLVIQKLGQFVVAAVKERGAPGDLCVHVGGDDFAIVTSSDQAAAIADFVIARFGQEVPLFYSEEARTAGYIETKSRRGELTRYPLMTVSIGGVDTARRPITSYLQLTEIAAEVKGYAKSLEGNRLAMDRRQE